MYQQYVNDEHMGMIAVPNMGTRTVGVVEAGNDAGLMVEIEEDAVKNEYASKRSGKPVFENVVLFKITLPGGDQVVKKENEELKMRFPKQWAAYCAQKKTAFEGMPIEQWPVADKAQVKTLKANDIYSVEQFAAIPRDNAQSFGMGFGNLQEQAKAWVDKAGKGEKFAAILTEKEELEKKLSLAMKKIDSLTDRLDSLEEPGTEAKATTRGRK